MQSTLDRAGPSTNVDSQSVASLADQRPSPLFDESTSAALASAYRLLQRIARRSNPEAESAESFTPRLGDPEQEEAAL
jgi:hypothetical protein